MNIKNPTLRKIRNRGLTPIRYRSHEQVRHGWIVEERTRGALTVYLIGNEGNTRLSGSEARYVEVMA